MIDWLTSWLDRRFLERRALFREQMMEGLVKEKYICWQAGLVLRQAKREDDPKRKLDLQDLAIVMIEQQDKLNGGPSPENETLGTQLMGLRSIMDKYIQ